MATTLSRQSETNQRGKTPRRPCAAQVSLSKRPRRPRLFNLVFFCSTTATTHRFHRNAKRSSGELPRAVADRRFFLSASLSSMVLDFRFFFVLDTADLISAGGHAKPTKASGEGKGSTAAMCRESVGHRSKKERRDGTHLAAPTDCWIVLE